jgi:hypothetical protein
MSPLVLAVALVAQAPASPDAGAEARATADSGEKKSVQRIAVYRLEGGGIDERILDVLTDSTVKELRKLEKVTVVGMDEIRAMLDLEAQKQIVGCSDVSCVAEIAEALGVDEIVIGSVAVVGDSIAFGLKRIDQRSASTVAQYANRVEGNDPADVLALIGPAVKELLPDATLKPGMSRGVPPEIAARIHPPPLEPWVFWSVSAATGVAVLTGGAFTAWNLGAYASANEKVQQSQSGTTVSGAALNQDLSSMRTSFVGLVVAYGAAAVVGAGAGVVALFTDWDNARGAE